MEREFIGPGSIQQLSEILRKISPQKVFIVSGNKSYELSGAGKALQRMLKGTDHRRYSDFRDNPKFEDLLEGAKAIRGYAPDLVIAVGGGSVMDTAKTISILPLDERSAKKVITGETRPGNKIAPLVAIPTTAGSGSEATHFAVAYLNNEKYSVASDLLLPDYVILDPELTYSMPAYQTAVSGMDALCQGIESYWAKGANEQSRNYASKAIELVLRNVEQAVHDPNATARFEMMKGANYAGKAINISKTTAPHAISYAFTSYYGVPHGHAVALTLGEFITFNVKRAATNANKDLAGIMQRLIELFGSTNAAGCRDRFYQLMQDIGLDTRLREVIPEIDLTLILENINTERLGNHPISLTNTDIHHILQAIL